MNKLTFLFLLPCLVLFSCKEKEKKIYLTEVDTALERDINWIYRKIDRVYFYILATHLQEGSLPISEPLVKQAKNIYKTLRDFEPAFPPQHINYNVNPKLNLTSKIEHKNKTIQKSLIAYKQLSKIYDEMNSMNAINFGINKIVTIPKNTHLGKNEPLKVEFEQCEISDNGLKQKSYVNDKLIKVNGIPEYYLPGDSTQKMKPGKYKWNGNITITFKGTDSVFNFTETFIIKPACR